MVRLRAGAYLDRSCSDPPAQEASQLLEITVALLVVLLGTAAFVAFRARAGRPRADRPGAGHPAASHDSASASESGATTTVASEHGLAVAPNAGTAPEANEGFVPRSVPRAAPVDLSDVVALLREPLQRTLPEGFRLQVDAAPRLPPARADRNQVELMVAHLIRHASESMPDGGTVTVRTRGVDDGSVVLEVEGEGDLDLALLPRLFEPLSAGRAADQGLRLELATVHALAYQNHGTLRVDRGPGGTRVAIVLPPMREPKPDLEAFAAVGPESVLVVEDEAMVRDLVRRTLEKAGYGVVEAADPLTALEILERGDTTVDLLLSDIVMQHMPGTELVRRVRERWPLVRVLYMSGYGHDDTVVEGLTDDDSPLLAKPFTQRELLGAVRGALDLLPGPQPVAGNPDTS